MEDSTSRAAAPDEPVREKLQGWHRYWRGVISFLESVGEVLHGMDVARRTHPTISAYHDRRR